MKINIFHLVFPLLFLSFDKKGGLNYPQYFPKPVYDFSQNPLNPQKVELGRLLFYDPILSADSTISCASCHSPYNAFAHTDHDLSHGIQDKVGMRNAPALFNLAWQSVFMWDGAISHLDKQALAPISDEKEMGSSIQMVLLKLNSSPFYQKMFKRSFHQGEIKTEHILQSLAQFQLTLVSANSRYDQMRMGKVQFSGQEQNGYSLFQKHCHSCHTEPLFTNGGYASNGLSIDSSIMDAGKGRITLLKKDSFQFKIPSLRNLSYSYPYMHDGRFKSLSKVIQHYQSEKKETSGLPENLKNGIALNTNEKRDLIAFLLTLDDKEFIFDKRHGFPSQLTLKKYPY